MDEPTAQDPLKIWSAQLRERAVTQLKLSLASLAKAVSANLPEKEYVSERQVQSWLEGSSAPVTTEVHNALLEALLLKYRTADPNLTPPQQQMALRRFMFEASYEAIPREQKRLDRLSSPPPTQSVDDLSSEPKSMPKTRSISAHERTPPMGFTGGKIEPIHKGPEYYEELPPKQWQHIRETTQNAMEYLVTTRLLKGLTRGEVAKRCDRHKSWLFTMEVKYQLPGADSIALLKEKFFGDEASSDKFDALVFSNRRTLMNHAWENGRHQIFSSHIAFIPQARLRNELRDYLSNPSEQQPDSLIKTRGIYVSLMRHIAGFATFTESGKTFDMSPSLLQSYERYDKSALDYPNSSVGKYIAKLEAAIAAQEEAQGLPMAERLSPYFAAQRWKALPILAPQKTHTENLAQLRDDDPSPSR